MNFIFGKMLIEVQDNKGLLDENLVTLHTCYVCKKVYKTPLALRNHKVNMHMDSPKCVNCR